MRVTTLIFFVLFAPNLALADVALKWNGRVPTPSLKTIVDSNPITPNLLSSIARDQGLIIQEFQLRPDVKPILVISYKL
ncbi:hypothetical protein [Vibrio alfacsensis]|uniref:hypothetical protein n=1 Tax=Vibrio alfacsensis TaxID=1074311 RepID=UPI001BF134D4|nr:hypothetical protein [Vibrio alfacsensis]BCN24300.1 hypothetical protein VYA_14920 [Vibrio alfacsensis]